MTLLAFRNGPGSLGSLITEGRQVGHLINTFYLLPQKSVVYSSLEDDTQGIPCSVFEEIFLVVLGTMQCWE